MKTLAQLQAEHAALGLEMTPNGRPKKETYINALRDHHWKKNHPDEPLPLQIMPMLLADWADLDESEAKQIERDDSGWIVQPKLDGVRALLHLEEGRRRITSRCICETTYRISELQNNVPHLTEGLSTLAGTVLDGEIVCPVAQVNTGRSVTAHPLQAAVAILSTTPENARRIQERHDAHLRLHVFDILQHRGTDVTRLPVQGRLDLLHQAINRVSNPHVQLVPSFVIAKLAVHQRIVDAGNEGTVWKRTDRPYEPGHRAKHWIKRKRGMHIEAIVTGFKPGTSEKGHADLIGAVEFSVEQNGMVHPIAWVSGWTDAERREMTEHGTNGALVLNRAYHGRRALIFGQGLSAKSRRLRGARLIRWVD